MESKKRERISKDAARILGGIVAATQLPVDIGPTSGTEMRAEAPRGGLANDSLANHLNIPPQTDHTQRITEIADMLSRYEKNKTAFIAVHDRVINIGMDPKQIQHWNELTRDTTPGLPIDDAQVDLHLKVQRATELVRQILAGIDDIRSRGLETSTPPNLEKYNVQNMGNIRYVTDLIGTFMNMDRDVQERAIALDILSELGTFDPNKIDNSAPTAGQKGANELDPDDSELI